MGGVPDAVPLYPGDAASFALLRASLWTTTPACGQLGRPGGCRPGSVVPVRHARRMPTSSDASPPLSPRVLLAALLDLVLPGSCGGPGRARAGVVCRLRRTARPAPVADAARWPAGRGGRPVPRPPHGGARVQGARAAGPRRSAGRGCSCPRSPRPRVRRRRGWCPHRPGRPQRAPAVATTCPAVRAPGPRRRRDGCRRRCGSVGGRATRSGWTPRRCCRPCRAAPRRRPGTASRAGDGDHRRRRRHHRGDAAGVPGRPREREPRRYGGDRPGRCDHPDNIKKYPVGCREKLRTVATCTDQGHSNLQICCRTVMSDRSWCSVSERERACQERPPTVAPRSRAPVVFVLRYPPRRERGDRVEIVVTGRNVEVPEHFRVHVTERG